MKAKMWLREDHYGGTVRLVPAWFWRLVVTSRVQVKCDREYTSRKAAGRAAVSMAKKLGLTITKVVEV